MKLKVVSKDRTMAAQGRSVILMCNYKEGSQSLKFIQEHPVGAVFEVPDHIGAALVGAPHLSGSLEIVTGESKSKMIEKASATL